MHIENKEKIDDLWGDEPVQTLNTNDNNSNKLNNLNPDYLPVDGQSYRPSFDA